MRKITPLLDSVPYDRRRDERTLEALRRFGDYRYVNDERALRELLAERERATIH